MPTHKEDTSMSNADEFHAKRIAPLRDLAARFRSAGEIIQRLRPAEPIGDFPSLEGADVMHHGDFGVLEVQCGLAVKFIEQRANALQDEAEEADRLRAESVRRQNMTEDEAWREKIERALAYQGAEIAKLKGEKQGRLPALPHVSRAEIPQFQGMPRGMGRHGVAGPSGSGGVRKLGTNDSPIPEVPSETGFTRRPHPLDVIGTPGRGR
jgi:hypothetical protein